MEADNIPRKPNMKETDRKSVDQDGAGQEEVKTLRNAIQVCDVNLGLSKRPLTANDLQQLQPNGVIAMCDSTARLSSRNHFNFLHLPAEVRNMVYRNGTIYGTTCATYASEADLVGRAFNSLPNLRQPPIAQVNRQIRHECLHIFYEMFRFSFDLNVRSEELADEPYLLPAPEDIASLRSFHEMIQAFAPSPKNTLQVSNLCFLSSLTVRVNVKGCYGDLGCIGFRMTSADEGNLASLDVCDLDWNCRKAVLCALMDAVRGSAAWRYGNLGEGSRNSDKLGYFAHQDLVEKISNLLCLIAEHCPQLTRSVSLIYHGLGFWVRPGMLMRLHALQHMPDFFDSSDTVV